MTTPASLCLLADLCGIDLPRIGVALGATRPHCLPLMRYVPDCILETPEPLDEPLPLYTPEGKERLAHKERESNVF
jgi:hypothetical protein